MLEACKSLEPVDPKEHICTFNLKVTIKAIGWDLNTTPKMYELNEKETELYERARAGELVKKRAEILLKDANFKGDREALNKSIEEIKKIEKDIYPINLKITSKIAKEGFDSRNNAMIKTLEVIAEERKKDSDKKRIDFLIAGELHAIDGVSNVKPLKESLNGRKAVILQPKSGIITLEQFLSALDGL